ncbi:acyl-ACP thioesterase domain-containing protein [Intestinibacillus massiliensis]|uniref:acyl-ACP thioesterase domain-containing protein n=1 Tax=Intestinibacillus massiliensis TaxID=1871029 RepID=UPI000B3622B1|nr:acyl-ACP thioesterase domain-containing protein [Intestinibacillus massiliensis]
MVPTLESKHTLHFSHIDNQGVSRPSALFEFMQSAATRHANALHIGAEDLNILWVLTRMKLHQYRPLRLGETLRQQTWCAGAKGPNWCRGFRFWAGEDEVAAGYSIWAMLGREDHRIIRPTSAEAAKAYAIPPEGFPIPGKLACGALTPHHIHTVRYSNLDLNNHLNNARIVDLVSDGLELDSERGRFVSEIQVNYTAECVCGDEIALSTGLTADGARAVFGQVGDAVKFEAAARLSAF